MPRTTTIRIDEHALAVLRDLAHKQGQSLQSVLKDAIDRYRRERFLEEANVAFATLRNNPELWNEEQRERAIWDRAAGDGIERE